MSSVPAYYALKILFNPHNFSQSANKFYDSTAKIIIFFLSFFSVLLCLCSFASLFFPNTLECNYSNFDVCQNNKTGEDEEERIKRSYYFRFDTQPNVFIGNATLFSFFFVLFSFLASLLRIHTSQSVPFSMFNNSKNI